MMKTMTTEMDRREFLKAGAAVMALAVGGPAGVQALGANPVGRQFKLNLNVGNLGVKASQGEALKLAKKHGFEAVTPNPGALQKCTADELEQLLGEMKAANLTWGSAGTGSFFNESESKFAQSQLEIAKLAKTLQAAGVTRCHTWTGSSNSTLTYRENFKQHVERTRQIGRILADCGLRFGIEYIGTKTNSWRGKYPFVRTAAEMKELAVETGLANIGLVLDSWHWWQAGDTEADVLKLADQDIISVDLNDAPTEPPREQLPDSPRRLPCATGVINIQSFLGALIKVGYTGPVQAEPFDKSLAQMTADEAVGATAAAVKKAVALAGG